MRPRPSSTVRRALVVVAGLLVLGVASSCTRDDNSQERDPVRDDEGQVLESTEIEALRVQVGDCFDGAIPFTVETIDVVPCAQPHDHEVFAVFDVDPTPEPATTTTTSDAGEQDAEASSTTSTTVDLDEPFPGEARVQQLGERGCLVAFGAYVGAPYEVSALEIGLIRPTAESWELIGDREVVCTVRRADGAKLEGSVQGSGL